MSTLRTSNLIHGSSAVSNVVLDTQGRALFGPDGPNGRAALYVNPQNNRVGVNSESPAVALDVDGAINTTGNVTVGGTLNLTGDLTASIINAGSGTAAAPSVSVGTTDNGLYSPGADQVAISTNGTGQMFVDSSGRVGIGTSSINSSARLDIDAGTLPIGINLDSTNAGGMCNVFKHSGVNKLTIGTGGSTFLTGSSTADGLIRAEANLVIAAGGNTERLRIDSSGNVGIGTSSPSTKLHIASTAANGDVHVTNTSGQNCLLEIAGNGNTIGTGNALYGQDAANNIYAGWARGAHPVLFGTSNTERMRIDSSGNVGINITDPLYLLHLQNNTPGSGSERIDVHMTNDTTGHAAGNGVQFGYQNVAGAYIWNFENTPTYFGNNNSERLRILPTGGITFNGDSDTSNALDDYEEGSWIPGLYVNSGTHPTLTITSNYSSYTKVGSLVTFSADFVATVSSAGSGSGLRISLPFPPSIASGRTVYSGGPQGRASTGLTPANYEISWYYFTDGARLYSQSANGVETILSPSYINTGTNKRFCIGGFYYVD